MKDSTRTSVSGVYGMDRSTYPVQALLHSRTVVEKDGYVATGLLTYIEGEVIEIEMSEYKTFVLGDPVHLTVYSPVGIRRLQSTVIGKAVGALAVLLPPRSLIGLEEKRESSRIEVRENGSIRRTLGRDVVLSTGDIERIELEEWVPFVIRNISLSGVGFVLSDYSDKLPIAAYTVNLDLGFELSCELELVRSDHHDGQRFYGARFVGLDELQIRKLRAFLIREQVNAYYRSKGKKDNQRSFLG